MARRVQSGRQYRIGLRVCSLRRGLVLLGMLLVLGEARAQTETLSEAWRWVRYTTAAGLPSNEVLHLFETTSSTLWVKTEKGLAWYDGYRWHGVSAEEGLPGDSESSIVVPDLQGGLLVVMDNRLYQGDERGFAPLHVEYEGNHIAVQRVVPFEAETLLILSVDRLLRYRSGVAEPFPLPAELEQTTLRSKGALWRTENGSIWLNSPLGLFRWDRHGWIRHFETYVDLLHEDALGGILAVRGQATYGGLWTWRLGEPPRRLEQDKTWIAALGVGPQGDAVAAYTDGRVRLRRSGRWQWLAAVPEAMATVSSLLFQQKGDLWVGTNHGLYLHRGASTRWQQWRDAGEQVNDILLTRAGALWLATNEGVFIRRPDGTSRRITTIDGTPLRAVTGLAEDRNGGIWISSGSGFSGAYRWHEGAWRHVGPAQGLQASFIHKIIPDRSGRLWFLGQSAVFGGTEEEPEPGALVYEGGRFTRWGPEQGLLHGRVYAFAEGLDGARWFGTLQGLSRWKEGLWTHWTQEEGLRSHRVFTVAVGPDGRVWFGQQGHGLGYLDDEDRPQYLTIDDGLVDNRVWYLRVGPDDALWAATQGGLSRYQDGAFSSFDRAAGLNHPHVWPVLPLEDRVYVGSVGGGLYVLSLEETKNPPPIVDVAPPVVDVNDVFFRWQAFAFEGERSPEQIETRHRLDDASWSAWSTDRETLALNVSSGGHTFTVQARSLFGNVGGQGTAVPFRINLPFYQHPLFLSALGIWVLSLVGGGALYWRTKRRQLALLRQREAETKQLKEFYEAVLDNVQLQIAIFDLDGRFLYVNPASIADPELRRSVLGKTEADYMRQTGRPAAIARTRLAALRRAVGERKLVIFEEKFPTRSGETLFFVHSYCPMYDPDGAVSKVIGYRYDITARKQAEQEREHLIEELETKNAELDRFTYTVSHDLKSPLVTIKGFLGLLEKDAAAGNAELVQKDMAHINAAADKMQRLLGELLELSRVGRLINPPEEIALGDLVREAIDLVAGQVKERGVTVEIAPQMPVVLGDHARLVEVLQNLLDNAVKYMGDQPAPRVEIDAWQNGSEVVCFVKDNGLGIKPAYQEKVFGLFERLDNRSEGTGIGLALVKRIVEVHGGRIWIESEGEGTGSTFYFSLPLREAAGEASARVS